MAIRTARRSSFLAGMARAFDPGAALRGFRGRGATEADMLAMRSDWEAVGEDLWRALAADLTEARLSSMLREAADAPAADGSASAGGGGDVRGP